MIHTMSMQIGSRSISMSMDLDSRNQCDAGIINCCKAGKPCEPEVCHVMARVLQEGSVAVDGGANVGFFSILMSKLVGETGHVYAFEPGGNNLPKLAANLKLNNCNNVTAIDKPLAAYSGEVVTLHEHDHPGYNSLWPDLSKEITARRAVTTTTLEKELLGRVAPALIKLDIEGAELSALKGSGTLLSWQKPIIITEMNEAAFDRAGVSFDEFRGFMQERAYDAFMLFEDGNLPCFIPRNTSIVPTRLNSNVMFASIPKVEKLWPEVLV